MLAALLTNQIYAGIPARKVRRGRSELDWYRQDVPVEMADTLPEEVSIPEAVALFDELPGAKSDSASPEARLFSVTELVTKARIIGMGKEMERAIIRDDIEAITIMLFMMDED